MSFQSIMVRGARNARGVKQTRSASKTIENRVLSIKKLCRFLRKENIQIRHPKHLKLKHIQDWIKFERTVNHLVDRRIQCLLADLRVTLRALELNALADRVITKDFGVAGASRAGTGRAIPTPMFFERIRRVKDVGVLAALFLMFVFGFRKREAVMCRLDTLQRFQAEITRQSYVRLVQGAKSNRPRDVFYLSKEASLLVVDKCIQIASSNARGTLIKSKNLRAAKGKFERVAGKAGFVGRYSSHSIRYSWTVRSVLRYFDLGHGEREALLLTARDLGHGDGRIGYVRRVYAREMIDDEGNLRIDRLRDFVEGPLLPDLPLLGHMPLAIAQSGSGQSDAVEEKEREPLEGWSDEH